VTQPLLCNAAVPFGVVGGLTGAIMGSSFGFMAFLGVGVGLAVFILAQ